MSYRMRIRRTVTPATVAVTPATPSIAEDATQQMAAAVTNIFGDTITGTQARGTWSTDDAPSATVNASGLVTGVAAGNASINFTTWNMKADATPAVVTVTL